MSDRSSSNSRYKDESEDESSDWSFDSVESISSFEGKTVDEFRRTELALRNVFNKKNSLHCKDLTEKTEKPARRQMETDTNANHESIASTSQNSCLERARMQMETDTNANQESIASTSQNSCLDPGSQLDAIGIQHKTESTMSVNSTDSESCSNSSSNSSSKSISKKASSYPKDPMALHVAKAQLNLWVQYQQDAGTLSLSEQLTVSVINNSENYLSVIEEMFNEELETSNDSEYERLEHMYDTWSHLTNNTKSVSDLAKINFDDDTSSEEECTVTSLDNANENNDNELNSTENNMENNIVSTSASTEDIDVQPSTSFAEANQNPLHDIDIYVDVIQNPVVIRYMQEQLLQNNNADITEDDTLNFYSETQNLEHDFSGAGDFTYEVLPFQIIIQNINNNNNNNVGENNNNPNGNQLQ